MYVWFTLHFFYKPFPVSTWRNPGHICLKLACVAHLSLSLSILPPWFPFSWAWIWLSRLYRVQIFKHAKPGGIKMNIQNRIQRLGPHLGEFWASIPSRDLGNITPMLLYSTLFHQRFPNGFQLLLSLFWRAHHNRILMLFFLFFYPPHTPNPSRPTPNPPILAPTL